MLVVTSGYSSKMNVGTPRKTRMCLMIKSYIVIHVIDTARLFLQKNAINIAQI